MIENNQYYESKIKTSRINNKYHKTKWKKSWTIDNNEIITTTPTMETKDLRCKFVKAKDYLDLHKQLEEKQKIIDEALRLSEDLKEQIRLCTDAFKEKCKRGEASYFDNDIQYYNEDIEKIVEVLEGVKDE